MFASGNKILRLKAPNRAKRLPQLAFCNKDYTCVSFESIQKSSTVRTAIPIYRWQNWDSDPLDHLLQTTSPTNRVLQSRFLFLMSPELFPSVCATHNNPGTQIRTPMQALHCVTSQFIRIPVGFKINCFPELSEYLNNKHCQYILQYCRAVRQNP